MRVENEGERAGHKIKMEEWSNGVVEQAAPLAALLHYSITPLFPSPLERPAKILEAIEPFLDYVDAGGVAEPNGAIVAEGRAWDDCDVRLAE